MEIVTEWRKDGKCKWKSVEYSKLFLVFQSYNRIKRTQKIIFLFKKESFYKVHSPFFALTIYSVTKDKYQGGREVSMKSNK